jgi:vacuolar-type H+-ATPase subunit F/Vma7
MNRTFAFKLYLLAARCCLLILCLLSVAYPDNKEQIQLGFIYNFTKFITWPNLTATTNPLVICVVGSQALSSQMSLLENKKVNSRLIQVRLPSQVKQASDCNMLFVSESENSHLEKILAPIATQPIVTVSTIPDFVQAGGMIGLKIVNDRVRFDINSLATQKAGLSISSQLLSLADEVIQ